MTRAQFAEYKTAYIDKQQRDLRRLLSTMEKKIYGAILDKVFNSMSVRSGIVSANQNNIALTAQVDKVFESLQRNEFQKVVSSIVSDFRGIAGKNAEYFKIMGETQKSITAVYDQSKEQLNRALGISGKQLTGGGFLDRLITDDTFKTKIKSALTSGIVSNQSFETLKSDLKTVIVGNDKVNGGLQKHFETNLLDTYNSYDRSIGNNFASRLGLRTFIFAGGKIKSSRQFCREHDGKVFTIEESDAWKSMLGEPDGPIWDEAIDGSYNPRVQMGGYRCRHSVDWISKQEAIRRRPELRSYFEARESIA